MKFAALAAAFLAAGCSHFTRSETLVLRSRGEAVVAETRVVQGEKVRLGEGFEVGLGLGAKQDVTGSQRPVWVVDWDWDLGDFRVSGTADLDDRLEGKVYFFVEARY